MVTATRTRKIISVNNGYPGTTNDITAAWSDPLLRAVHIDGQYANAEFDLYTGEYDANDEPIMKTHRGFWLMVDGGQYLHMSYLMCA